MRMAGRFAAEPRGLFEVYIESGCWPCGLTFDLRLRSFEGAPFSSIGPRNEFTESAGAFLHLVATLLPGTD